MAMTTEKKKTLLLLTQLDVWTFTGGKGPKIGNQSLYNTLRGYASGGWDVHVLTCADSPDFEPRLPSNITIHRKPTPLARQLRRAYDGLASGLGRLFRSRVDQDHAGNVAPMTRLRDLWLRRYSRSLVRGARTLVRQLGGVDMLYGYEIHGALAAHRLRRELNLPVVTRFQGTELVRYLGQPSLMSKTGVFAEALAQPSDLIIMANDGTRGDAVLEALGVPSARVRFWMNGVEKAEVHRGAGSAPDLRRALGVSAIRPLILHAGRLFHWKRVDRHLEVLARVRDRGGDFVAVFVGAGPDQELALELRDRLRLSDRVQFLGAHPHDRVMEYMNACDIYISFYDLSNLSNGVIEACVSGKCIVTTAVGGTSDLLRDGVDAAVVAEHDDPDAIAGALHRVVAEPQERSRLAGGARTRGASLLTWEERMVLELRAVDEAMEAWRNGDARRDVTRQPE
jgi:glycosyltransferase involved in cell wall biosynthesis